MSTANFRTAVRGFHRADVVNFIEETTLAHEKKLRKLKEEKAELQAQLSAALAEKEQLAMQLEMLQSRTVQESAYDDQVVSDCAAEPFDLDAMELAAYRRAEAAERSAQQRANQLLRQVDTLVEDTGARFSCSADEIAALGSDVQSGLERLQEAFAELNLLLESTAQSLAEITPLTTLEEDV